MLEKSLILLGILSLSIILIPNNVFAQSDELPTFHAKSTIVGEHFTGGTMWTAIEGDKATTIVQWSLGRSLIHSDVLPISDCEPIYSICLEVTVTDSQNSVAAKAGDQFIIKIDPENKKHVIVGKSGVLENIEIILEIDKIYKITGVSTEPRYIVLGKTLTESQHAISFRKVLDDGLFGIQIGEAAAASTAISDDERAQSITVHFSSGLIPKPVAVSNFIKFQLTSSIKDERGSLPIYKFSDKPSFYLESLPTTGKKDFYKGVNNWMTKSTAVSPFDVSIDVVSGKGTKIYTWGFSRCELTGFGTYLQDIINIYQFSNIENAEIRERATFVCSGLKLNVP
jgi:hypothetical protein